MKSRTLTRLAKLEAMHAEGRLRRAVVWIGPDGEPETPLADLPEDTRYIVLPRKAASADAWAVQVHKRWPEYGGGQR